MDVEKARNRGVLALGAAFILLAGCSASEEPKETEPRIEETRVVRQKLQLPPLHPEADTRIASAVPFGNDGTGNNLGVTSATAVDLERSLIRFNQAAIAAAVGSEALHSARLDLHVSNTPVGWLGAKIDLLPMTVSWPEGTGLAFGGHGPTWVCRDDPDTSSPFGVFTNNCQAGDEWGMLPADPDPQPFSTPATARASIFTGGLTRISFDVTRDIQRFLNGEPNDGWILVGTGGPLSGTLVNFASRETSDPPELILEVGPDLCPSDPNKGAPGECGCGIPDIDTNFDGVADCFDFVVEATADTTLRLAVPFGNDGTGTFLGVTDASVASLERTLVRVDQAAIDAVRDGRNVDAAYLDLTIAGVGFNWGGAQLEILPMIRDWEEGTGLAPGGHGATWVCANDPDTSSPFGFLTNNCQPGDEWAMEPAQPEPLPFDTTPTDTQPLFWPGMTSVRFDVTADVQRYIEHSDPNYGWIIKGTQDLLSGELVNFGSRESGAPPRLLLETSSPCAPCEAGAACLHDSDCLSGSCEDGTCFSDLVPTLNCVTQLDANTYGAVFGYRNETGGPITLGPGPQNEMSPGEPDVGQPILFVPGEVPIASFRIFAASDEVAWTLRKESAVASASSPACPVELASALSELYGHSATAAAIYDDVADILSDPRYADMVSAIRAEEGPNLTPFESSLLDALELIIANADLLANPATLTPEQLDRIPAFRASLLENQAGIAMRIAGDGLRAATASGAACTAIASLNASQPGQPLIPVQPESLQSKFIDFDHSTAVAQLHDVLHSVAIGTAKDALLTLPGSTLAVMMPEEFLDILELPGPIPVIWKKVKKVGGAFIGGVIGGAGTCWLAGAVPPVVVACAVGFGVVAGAAVALDFKPCKACTEELGCPHCINGCCRSPNDVESKGKFLIGNACPDEKIACTDDDQCGLGRCVGMCCEDEFFDLCPGFHCNEDADCSGGELCQWGCCTGKCGLGGTECDVVEEPMCSTPKTCPSNEDCVDGCCSGPIIR